MKNRKTYKEKLLSPKWQKKRLEVLQSAGWKCKSCLSEHETLHVHHKRYRRCEPWEYLTDEFMALCEPCHTRLESAKAKVIFMIGELLPGELDAVKEFIEGRFSPPAKGEDYEEATEAELDAFFENLKSMFGGPNQ